MKAYEIHYGRFESTTRKRYVITIDGALLYGERWGHPILRTWATYAGAEKYIQASQRLGEPPPQGGRKPQARWQALARHPDGRGE